MQTHAITVQECLDPYERHFSNIILGLDRPILMGETILRKKHHVAAGSIKKINDMPLEKKKELIQLIMGCLPKDNSVQEFEIAIINFRNAEKTISKPEFKELENEFNKLSTNEQEFLLKATIINSIGFLNLIQSAIDDILFLTDEPEQALIAKQTVNNCIALGNLLLKMHHPFHIGGKTKTFLDKNYKTLFEALMITIIQLEGVRIGKIKPEVLYNSLAFISQFTTPTVNDLNSEVYAVMGT